ncbi:MAG: SRPBCC family protein [Ramlibacter sp.]|nr:SRPBCC family protein [Ramlibacter sp.]
MKISSIRSFYAGLLMAGVTATAPAAAGTITVTEKVDLAASPARAWDTIRDFMGWQDWHPAFAKTELVKGDGNTQGSVRLLTAKDGAQFTEELVQHAPMSRMYKYRIMESPAPVSGYVSTLEVRERNGGSTVVWSSTFTVKSGTTDDEARKLISGIYRLGLDNLAKTVK